jgi:small subunit ribosomal protein S20
MTQAKFILKAIRKAERNRLQNRIYKSAVRTLTAKASVQIENLTSDTLESTQNQINLAYSRIDKAIKKGALHKKTGARKKSRLLLAFKKASAEL